MKSTKYFIGIIIGMVLMLFAIVEGDKLGMIQAMLFIIFIHIMDISSRLSEIEKDEVSK